MNLRNGRKYRCMFGFTALASTLVWATTLSGIAQAQRTIGLDAGSVIPVRLKDTISSNDSQKGDRFTATIRTDDTSESYLGLPAGTKVDGVVRAARPKRDKDPGVLDIAFDRLILPDGRSYAIDGSLIGLDNKSIERKSDGRMVAKPGHKNDRLTYVGYGAGAGLIVGLLTKHALEDTLIGGGLGYLFGSLQKGHSDARDVVLKPGTEMGVRLDRRVNVASYIDDNRDTRYHRGNGDTNDYDRPYNTDDRYTDNRFDRNRNDSTDIGVLIDDNNVRFASTARPILSQNIVLVPLFPVLKAARVPYNYNTERGAISATGQRESVRFSLGSRIAVVNGNQRVRLEAPVQKLNGTVYVSMRALALATGQDVSYDSYSRTITVNPKDR